MAKRWNYCGDINLKHGGTFYRATDWNDVIEAVRVTPSSEGGGPDNLFIIEPGTLYVTPERLEKAFECSGYEGTDFNQAPLLEKVMALESYYGIETDPCALFVRIGPKENARDFADKNDDPDYVLRSNAKLKNFVRREFLS